MTDLQEIEAVYPEPIASPHNRVMRAAIAIDDVRSYCRMIFEHSLAVGMHTTETGQHLLARSIEDRLLAVQADLAGFATNLMTGRWAGDFEDDSEDEEDEG